LPLLERLWPSVRRGLQILGLAFLFRLQEFGQWLGGADWRGLLRVDILNTIGFALVIIGLAQALAPRRLRLLAFAVLSLAVGFLSPLAWSSPALSAWPWPVRDYLGGRPAHGYFPLFPWLGLALAGAATGAVVAWYRSRARPKQHYLYIAYLLAGALLVAAGGLAADRLPHPAGWLFWHNSGEYLVIRIGIQLLALAAAFFVCLPFRSHSFSTVRLLGRHSLAVYWVHISLVYGVWLHFLKQRLTVWQSAAGVALLSGLMVLLALGIDRWPSLKSHLLPKRSPLS
jgi:uncharacterized membrane protein